MAVLLTATLYFSEHIELGVLMHLANQNQLELPRSMTCKFSEAKRFYIQYWRSVLHAATDARARVACLTAGVLWYRCRNMHDRVYKEGE